MLHDCQRQGKKISFPVHRYWTILHELMLVQVIIKGSRKDSKAKASWGGEH